MKQIYDLSRVVFLVFVLGFFSCEKDDNPSPNDSPQEISKEEFSSEKAPPNFSFATEPQLINSKFYSFYEQRLSKSSFPVGNGSLLDSLILEKTVVYEKEDTTYYTIPFKYYTDEVFYTSIFKKLQTHLRHLSLNIQRVKIIL